MVQASVWTIGHRSGMKNVEYHILDQEQKIEIKDITGWLW